MNGKSTLYIDESGKSSLRSTKEPFIITGAIVDDEEAEAIEGYFTYIKRKFKIDENKPFHSYHTFEHPETKLTDNKLVELANSLAEFVSLIPIKVKVIEVDKELFRDVIGVTSNEDFKFDKNRKRIADFPYRVMASVLFAWFAEHLDDLDQIGQVISDSRRGGDHQLLKTLNLCKEGHVPFDEEVLSDLINKRVSAICFAEKNFLSGGLEITDLVSYITFVKVRRLISKNENIGVPVLWESIRNLPNFSHIELKEKSIRKFFGLKENEVHKYLRN